MQASNCLGGDLTPGTEPGQFCYGQPRLALDKEFATLNWYFPLKVFFTVMYGSKAMKYASLREAAGSFWRRYVVAQEPDASREGIRQQRIDDLTVCAGLLEAMRLWDEDRKVRAGEMACA